MDRPLEQIVLETPRYRVEGNVMLPPEGYKSRLSDHLNDPDREFLIVLDAKLSPLEGEGQPSELPVVMIQRNRIDLVIPANAGG